MSVPRTGTTSTWGCDPESIAKAEEDFGIEHEPAPISEAPAGDPIPMNEDGSYDLSKLSKMSQEDGNANTVGDSERCSANSTVVALASGGKDKLLAGVQGARDEIQKRIMSASNPAEAQVAFGNQLYKLDVIESHINSGQITTTDLNEMSSVLYQTFATHKGAGYMDKDTDVLPMQKAVGLVSPGLTGENPIEDPEGGIVGKQVNGRIDSAGISRSGLASAQQRCAEEAFSYMEAGDTATARVFNGTGLTGMPNHYVTMGKDKSGNPYVYDPLGTPNYRSGDDAVQYLASKVGLRSQATRERGVENLVVTLPTLPATPSVANH